jgi:serine/threonine-protein kinase
LTIANDLNIGEHVGNYTLARKIGQGGLGEVWLAHHSKLAHKPMVALKFVLQPRAKELERFEREVEILDMLRTNRHIIKAEDYGEHDNKPYLVMEYAPGGDLASSIKKKLPLETLADYLEQIADGLDFAHSKGIIHRDLKPSNILFGEGDTLLLADFGVAHEENYDLTETGLTLGTLEYMAPEQFNDAKRVTAAADIYSLGIIMFQLITRKLPFGHRGEGKTPYQLMHDHCTLPVPQLNLYDANLPPGLQAVIERVLAKKPEARYSTAGEFASAFRAALPSFQSYIAEALNSMPPVDAPILEVLNELPPLPTAATTQIPASYAGAAQPLSAGQALPAEPVSSAETLGISDQVYSVLSDPLLQATPKKSQRAASSWMMLGFLGVIVLILSVALVLAVVLVLPKLNNPKSPTNTVPPTTAPATPTVAAPVTPLPGQKVRVPDVSRKTVVEAQEALKNAHLQVGETRYDYSNEVEAGKVINTLPRAGNEVDPNTAVGLVISRGRTT